MIARLSALAGPAPGIAQESPFPVPGLEGAVEFWRQVFARYGSPTLRCSIRRGA
ncbi:MAG: hypothetical protein ACM3SP_03615 [Chloroflexota bacterium]